MILVEKQQKYLNPIIRYNQQIWIPIGEEILPSNQKQIIEHAKYTYSLLGMAFEKQTKTIEDQGSKQIEEIQNPGQVKSQNNTKVYYNVEDIPLISK